MRAMASNFTSLRPFPVFLHLLQKRCRGDAAAFKKVQR